MPRRPVIHDFVVVPLPDLRYVRVECPDVVVHQVVQKIAPKLIDRFGDFAFRFGCYVPPDCSIGERDLGGDRIIGVNRVAAVNEKIRFHVPHLFVDAHTAEIRIDAVALSDCVSRPEKSNVPRNGRRGTKCPDHWFARVSSITVLKTHANKIGLAGSQSIEVDPACEIGRGGNDGPNDATRIIEVLRRSILDHHPRQAVRPRPYDRATGIHVSDLNAMTDLGHRCLRSNQRRKCKNPRPVLTELPPIHGQILFSGHGSAKRRRLWGDLVDLRETPRRGGIVGIGQIFDGDHDGFRDVVRKLKKAFFIHHGEVGGAAIRAPGHDFSVLHIELADKIVVEPARVKVSRSHRLILKLDGTGARLFQRPANAVQREIIIGFVVCVGISHRPPDDDSSLERAKLLFCDLTQVPQENGNEVFNRMLPSVNACSREKLA